MLNEIAPYSINEIYQSNVDFDSFALRLFQWQYQYIPVYRKYCELRKIKTQTVTDIFKIPFLPISVFKNQTVLYSENYEKCFLSSGTTGQTNSKHAVYKLDVYNKNIDFIFNNVFHATMDNFVILGLLPTYADRNNSSLAYMVQYWKNKSKEDLSEIYLHEHDLLYNQLQKAKSLDKNIILIGLSSALVKWAKNYMFDYNKLTVIETGGMKGLEEEWDKKILHQFLKNKFINANIGSEYGMTELLSQAFAINTEKFTCPFSMKVIGRDLHDPYKIGFSDKTQAINVIDLANIYSCGFIATDDIGKVSANDFTIEGRLQNAELRGCNSLIEM